MARMEKNVPETLFHIKPEEWQSTGSPVFPELTYRGNNKADFLRKLRMPKNRGTIRSMLDRGKLSLEQIQIRASRDFSKSLRFVVSYVEYFPQADSFYERTEGYDSHGRFRGVFGQIMYHGDDARLICVNPEDLAKRRRR